MSGAASAESKRNPQTVHHRKEAGTLSAHAGQAFVFPVAGATLRSRRFRSLTLKPAAIRRCCVTAHSTKPWNWSLVFQPHEQSAPQRSTYALNTGPLMMHLARLLHR
jgi:hypothetical protein